MPSSSVSHGGAQPESRLQLLLSSSPAIIYTLQPTGDLRVTYMSPNVERIFGYTPDAFLSDPTFWRTHVHPDDAPHVFSALPSLFERGEAIFEYRFLKSSGEYHWIHDSARLLRHDDGTPDEIIGYWVDIQDRKVAEEALHQSETQYQELFRKIPIPTYMWQKQGEDFVLIAYNEAAFSISDGKIPSLLGMRLRDLYADSPETLQDFLSCIGNQAVVRREMLYDLKSSGLRKHLWVHYAFVPPDMVIVHTEDISERKHAEEVLRDREARLRRAESLARIGHYAFDGAPDYGNVVWSEGLEKIWDFELRSGEPMDSYVPRIHPDDRKGVMDELVQATTEERGFDIEYRIVHQNGKIVTVHSVAEFTPGEQGHPGRFFGTMIDISPQKQIESQLRESLREKETLLREIHHRVKNNLQIISSLLYFQGKRATEPESAKIFLEGQNRLRAMILVHEQLYRASSLSQIDFASYVRSLLQQLSQSYSQWRQKIDLSVDVEPIQLPIEIALPCGMILNELLTNVFKYAYLNGQSGAAVVKIVRTETGLQIQVSDSGVGLPDSVNVAKPTSFGLRLIHNLAAQVNGTVRYEQGHGTRAIVTIDLPERTNET